MSKEIRVESHTEKNSNENNKKYKLANRKENLKTCFQIEHRNH